MPRAKWLVGLLLSGTQAQPILRLLRLVPGAVGDLLQATDEAAERVEESWGVKSVRSAEWRPKKQPLLSLQKALNKYLKEFFK